MSSYIHITVSELARSQAVHTDGRFVQFPFYSGETALIGPSYPLCGMSLKRAGSMRFRWNEHNVNRSLFLEAIASLGVDDKKLEPTVLELVHSKIVYEVKNRSDTEGRTGDGMITTNATLLPVVTVADCMPIFLYDPVSGFFGALHSGWKGTGIAGIAIEKACAVYGAQPENICVVLGPHIRNCCYIVNGKRAAYFRDNFCRECVEPVSDSELKEITAAGSWNEDKRDLYHLSLEKANLALLRKVGIREENIACATDCTCCDPLFGSFRRETAQLSGSSDQDTKWKSFTVQAAFCGFMTSV